jgi:hypothetical protein
MHVRIEIVVLRIICLELHMQDPIRFPTSSRLDLMMLLLMPQELVL